MSSVPTKVLVVDDDPDLQEILGICLRHWGFEVASAGNGDDGARLAESYRPDIVLSDVMMPDTSGIDLLRSLLSEEPGRPVILMTGYSNSDMLAATRWRTTPISSGVMRENSMLCTRMYSLA